MPTAAQAAGFQHLLGRLADGANRAVAGMFGHGNLHDYPAIVDPFLAASAQMSAHWYHSLAPAQPFAATVGPLPDHDVLSKNVDWAMSTPNPREALGGSVFRHIYQTSAATIVHNADREGVRYARYASANACAFCRLLTTKTKGLVTDKGVRYDPDSHSYKFVVIGRGGRARGTRAIGDSYHDNCKCTAVPIRPGDSYTPPPYVKQWEDDYTAAAADPDTHGFDDIVNHMRRTEYGRAHPKPESVFASLSND